MPRPRPIVDIVILSVPEEFSLPDGVFDRSRDNHMSRFWKEKMCIPGDGRK